MSASDKKPRHVGVIMDGNGRWAENRGLRRIEGHRKGSQRAKEIIKAAAEAGIGVLTLYTFSLENWQRPKSEVSMLMKLLERYLKVEMKELHEMNLVFRAIGDRLKLPVNIQELIAHSEQETSRNTGMVVVAALSYGGRDEIVRAVKRAIESGSGAGEISEKTFPSFLDTAGLPDTDLIIRTSGEIRISNFLIWQSAYCELYFTNTQWPDFTREEFLQALNDYSRRERRFGAVMSKGT